MDIRNRFDLSRFKPAEWRAEYLRKLDESFAPSLDQIWELLKGGTENSLVGDVTREELALVLSEVLIRNQRRYDKHFFQQHQEDMKEHGLPMHPEWPYFEVIKHALFAAERSSQELTNLVETIWLLDLDHITQFIRLVDEISIEQLQKPSSEGDFMKYLQKIARMQQDIDVCRIALTLATGQTTQKPHKGRPMSEYSTVAVEAGELWERLTDRPVVTPKSISSRTARRPRPESPQLSTQFIHLIVSAIDPTNKLRETRSAIRNALSMRKSMQKLREDVRWQSGDLTERVRRLAELTPDKCARRRKRTSARQRRNDPAVLGQSKEEQTEE